MVEFSPIGLFGGTFDPIHFGHLRLGEELRLALSLDAVHFVPAGRPWQRQAPGASALQRLDMVRLAVAGNPAFVADGREVARCGPAYTVDSVEEIRGERPDASVCILLGADALLNLETWHRWESLFDIAHFGVAWRPGHAMAPDSMPARLREQFESRITDDPRALRRRRAGAIFVWRMTPLDISASGVRAQFEAGKSARYLLPDAVLDYIESKGLYSAEANGT
jgi:nicotinate-nucleotide adenylyltransferase